MKAVIGKTCPYCQTPIKPGESVVFCSACSIPHHQQCWDEARGCTTFGCSGNPSIEPSNQHARNILTIDMDVADTNVSYCSHCGSPINDRAVYCSRCGIRLKDITGPRNPPIQVRSQHVGNNSVPMRLSDLLIVIPILLLLGVFLFNRW